MLKYSRKPNRCITTIIITFTDQFNSPGFVEEDAKDLYQEFKRILKDYTGVKVESVEIIEED